SSWLGIFQALIGGLLLHVVVHRSTVASDPKHQPRIRIAANIGGLAGLGLLAVLMPGGAVHHHEGAAVEPGVAMVSALFALARESAPALLLGFMLAGLVAAYLPTASLQWLRRGSRFSQSLRGVVLGLPLPLCSCGVIPVYRSLVKRGIPTT